MSQIFLYIRNFNYDLFLTKYFSSFPFPFLDYQILLISCCVKYEIKSGNDENPQNKFLTVSFNQPNF